MNDFSHKSVLLDEAVAMLAIKSDGIYVDGTFGRGGHSSEILDRLDKQGKLIAFDKDLDAIEYGKKKFAGDDRIQFVNSSFTCISQISKERNLANYVNGILLDLGVSSPQILDSTRGFSFTKDGPLDMRMDRSNGMTAAAWLNTAPEAEIAKVLYEYGEEKCSRKIARAIVNDRIQIPFTSTLQLAELCNRIVNKQHGKHPATRTFQAIRIKINNELSDLHEVLESAYQSLAIGGRLVVISFHSLEDRIVKLFMNKKTSTNLPNKLPIKHSEILPDAKIIGKKIKPSLAEITENPQARSAVMRVLEKVNVSNN